MPTTSNGNGRSVSSQRVDSQEVDKEDGQQEKPLKGHKDKEEAGLRLTMEEWNKRLRDDPNEIKRWEEIDNLLKERFRLWPIS